MLQWSAGTWKTIVGNSIILVHLWKPSGSPNRRKLIQVDITIFVNHRFPVEICLQIACALIWMLAC